MKKIILFLFGGLFFFWPSNILAGNYTLPITDYSYISAWFDHTTPQYSNDQSQTMTKYDGSTGATYNGHNGIDYATDAQGKDVFVAGSGVVRDIKWQNPNNPYEGYGYFIRIWHNSFSQSTLYGHLQANSEQEISVGSNVNRRQLIAKSGNTGDSSGPHLHFSVFNNDSLNTNNSIDPYGWSGSGSDPWTIDQGYLWTTNPPSINGNPTSPNLSSPSNNSTVDSLGVNFVWYGATDPDGDSPLDYSLVIKDSSGATVLETAWLESTYSYSYTFPSNGNYTWFVKVGDRHGGQNQSSTWNLTISVPSPTVSLSASRVYTQAGRKVMLSWSSTNATSVASSNFGATSVSGTTTAYPTKTTTYTITVNGNPGSNPSTATSNVTIYVSPLGDFNRDGNSDVAGQYNPYGDWWVGTNNNNSAFNGMTKWLASQLANTNINVLHGDYNNDGYLDIAARDISAGNWWIGLNNGNDTYASMQMVLSNQAAGSDYDVFGGDFNGDGLADFGVKYRPWGRWYIALNQGSLNFNTFQQWLDNNLAGNDSDTFTGDFNKDGYTDIGGRYRPNGDWWIGINSGNSTFNGMTQWLTGQAGGNDWDMIIADYNNDSYTDIGGRYRPNGDWWVGLNNQSSVFNNMTQWLVGQAGGANWDTFAGDFNKDGLADIGGRYSPYGDWWISLNTGNSDFGNMTKWLAGNAAGSGWNVINRGSE